MPDFFKLLIAGMLFTLSAFGFLWWIATAPLSFMLSAIVTVIVVWLLNIKRRS